MNKRSFAGCTISDELQDILLPDGTKGGLRYKSFQVFKIGSSDKTVGKKANKLS